MNAAHHLARQHIPCRDDQLKGRESDADGIGQVSPAAGAEAFRKAMLEIIEFDLDGRLGALSLQHRRRSPPRTLISLRECSPSWPGLSRPSTSYAR